MPSVNEPTRQNLGIRGASDAFVLFEAVRRGIYPLRRHRLSQQERDSLAPGQVFVWTESNDADGLERWTDGRKWSASRTRDVFLIYEEREEPSVDESVYRAAQRVNPFPHGASTTATGDLFGIFAFPQDRPPKVDGLMKQTFSAWVVESPGRRKKWHLSAYLSRQGPTDLPSVAEDSVLSRVTVPEHVYECCTGPRKSRRAISNRIMELSPGADAHLQFDRREASNLLPGADTSPGSYSSPSVFTSMKRPRRATEGSHIYTPPSRFLVESSPSNECDDPDVPQRLSPTSFENFDTAIQGSSRRDPRHSSADQVTSPPTPTSGGGYVEERSPLSTSTSSVRISETTTLPHGRPYIDRSGDDQRILAAFRPF